VHIIEVLIVGIVQSRMIGVVCLQVTIVMDVGQVVVGAGV